MIPLNIFRIEFTFLKSIVAIHGKLDVDKSSKLLVLDLMSLLRSDFDLIADWNLVKLKQSRR